MGSGNIKKLEVKLGKTGLMILIGGMVVLLCLSFVLGVGVGKNIDTYPEKISSIPQQVLALFWRPAKVASQQKSLAGKATETDKSMDLTFHNALTSPKAPSMQQLPVPEKKPDVNTAANQKIKSQPPSDASTPQEDAASPQEETPARKLPEAEKISAEKKAKVKDAPAPAQTAGMLYVVHVASLKDKNKAIQINKTVAAQGYSSKMVKTDVKGKGTWYRVMVPGFETKGQAQIASDKIARKVKTKCVIRAVPADADGNQ